MDTRPPHSQVLRLHEGCLPRESNRRLANLYLLGGYKRPPKTGARPRAGDSPPGGQVTMQELKKFISKTGKEQKMGPEAWATLRAPTSGYLQTPEGQAPGAWAAGRGSGGSPT